MNQCEAIGRIASWTILYSLTVNFRRVDRLAGIGALLDHPCRRRAHLCTIQSCVFFTAYLDSYQRPLLFYSPFRYSFSSSRLYFLFYRYYCSQNVSLPDALTGFGTTQTTTTYEFEGAEKGSIASHSDYENEYSA